MNSLFAGFMGIFASFGSFFHGGQPAKQPMMNSITHSATVSGTLTPGVGKRGGMMNRNGERPFFGTVTAVSGSTITVEMQRPIIMPQANQSITPTITPPAPRTIAVTVDSTTTYTGGALTDITTGTKIAGVGKATSDTAITAAKITINPTMPTGFPNGMPRGRGMHPGGQQGDNYNRANTPQ